MFRLLLVVILNSNYVNNVFEKTIFKHLLSLKIVFIFLCNLFDNNIIIKIIINTIIIITKGHLIEKFIVRTNFSVPKYRWKRDSKTQVHSHDALQLLTANTKRPCYYSLRAHE